MGEAGRRRVLGRSWDAVCAELVQYYQAVVKVPLSARP
jgi:hypothetical protein